MATERSNMAHHKAKEMRKDVDKNLCSGLHGKNDDKDKEAQNSVVEIVSLSFGVLWLIPAVL